MATAGIGAPAGLTAALDIYKPEGGRRSHPCRMLVDEIAMAEIVRALSVHQHLRRGQHPDSALGPLRGVGHVVDKARRGVQIELPWATVHWVSEQLKDILNIGRDLEGLRTAALGIPIPSAGLSYCDLHAV